jgi:hypothetical protein
VSTPLVTSVKVESRGGHEHVSIWVRGQLVGRLVVGPGDGERMRQAFGDPSWLVKDFTVLYRAAKEASDRALLGGYDTPEMRDLGRQVRRLSPAFVYCDGEPATPRLPSVERAEAGG